MAATTLGFINPAPKELVGRIENVGPLTRIRVRVFPHTGKYAAPHGLEKALDRVTIKALNEGASCRVSPAEKDHSSAPLAAETLSFDAKDREYPKWISCQGPAVIVRDGLASRAYAGLLQIQRVAKGGKPELQVVEHIDFEDYLRGVVPSEVPSRWDPEAIKAQAVAARTYAYSQIQIARRHGAGADFDVEDTISDQAYTGFSGRKPETDKAIDDTKGEIITYGNDVIKAYFFSDSGGHTEDSANLFGNNHYCKGKPEIYDLKLHDSTWSFSFTLKDLAARLVARGLLSPGDALVGASVDPARNSSGRVRFVWLELAGGTRKQVAGDQVRFAVGLRSTMYDIFRAEPGSVRIDGRGFGHGVGMSQRGAQLMAHNLGMDYRAILKFYFTGVQITPTAF